eukprot:sb/3460798/
MQPQQERSSRSMTSPGTPLPPTKGGGNMSLARLDAQSAISRGQRAAAAAGTKKTHEEQEQMSMQLSSASASIAAGVIRSKSHLGVSQASQQGAGRKGRRRSSAASSVSRMNSMQTPARRSQLQSTAFATAFSPDLQQNKGPTITVKSTTSSSSSPPRSPHTRRTRNGSSSSAPLTRRTRNGSGGSGAARVGMSGQTQMSMGGSVGMGGSTGAAASAGMSGGAGMSGQTQMAMGGAGMAGGGTSAGMSGQMAMGGGAAGVGFSGQQQMGLGGGGGVFSSFNQSFPRKTPQQERSSRSMTSPGTPLPPTKGGGNMSLARLDAQSAISRGQRAAAAAGKKKPQEEDQLQEQMSMQLSSASASIAAGVIRSKSGVSQASQQGRKSRASRRSSAASSVSRMNSMQTPARRSQLQSTAFATAFSPDLQQNKGPTITVKSTTSSSSSPSRSPHTRRTRNGSGGSGAARVGMSGQTQMSMGGSTGAAESAGMSGGIEAGMSGQTQMAMGGVAGGGTEASAGMSGQMAMGGGAAGVGISGQQQMGLGGGGGVFSSFNQSFPRKTAQYQLQEETCNLRNTSSALSMLNKWIHQQQTVVKEQSNNIPEGRDELEAFQKELRQGFLALEDREIHVMQTISAANKHIERLDDEKQIRAVTKMVSQVQANWDKLRANFTKLNSQVEKSLAVFTLNDMKLEELYQWISNFYRMVIGSIEDALTLVYEEQLYLLKLTKKIEERKAELELTIQQLKEFEEAVDKALEWRRYKCRDVRTDGYGRRSCWQTVVKEQSNNIPEGRDELEAFQKELRQGFLALEDREIHVMQTISAANKHIERLDDEKQIRAVTKMVSQVQANWDKLRANFTKLNSQVEKSLAVFTLVCNVFDIMISPIVGHPDRARGPLLPYTFQSYEYQIEEKMKVFAEIKITVTLSIEINAKLVVKIEAVFAKLTKKIEERKAELELTIQQLKEFEEAVDKALEWLGNQEIILKQIIVVQDEESLSILLNKGPTITVKSTTSSSSSPPRSPHTRRTRNGSSSSAPLTRRTRNGSGGSGAARVGMSGQTQMSMGGSVGMGGSTGAAASAGMSGGAGMSGQTQMAMGGAGMAGGGTSAGMSGQMAMGGGAAGVGFSGQQQMGLGGGGGVFSSFNQSFPRKTAQYQLQEETCNLRNTSSALSMLNKWIHQQQTVVKEQSNNIPEGRDELEAFQKELRQGFLALEDREIHVMQTISAANKHIERLDDEKQIRAVTKMVSQVQANWDKLRANFTKLNSQVEKSLAVFTLNDMKLEELYQWISNFYRMVIGSIEDALTLVYEEQLYLLKSYEYQIEEKMKVFAEIKITVTLSIEINAKLVVKIEAVFAKVGTEFNFLKSLYPLTTPLWSVHLVRVQICRMITAGSFITSFQLTKKIEERKAELELTIQQLKEFEEAVDKALEWLGNQEIILKQIIVVQDEESLSILLVQKEEVFELISHVKENMENIETVLKTGEEIGLKEMNRKRVLPGKSWWPVHRGQILLHSYIGRILPSDCFNPYNPSRFSLYTKLVNLNTRWTQLDVDCHQKIIQIELNVLSIKEYVLLQWLVKQEERLTVNIEIIIRIELEEIRAQYKLYKLA